MIVSKSIMSSLLLVIIILLVNGCDTSKETISKIKTPNIIYILADDLGSGDISALNRNSKIKTVNIDAMADQGMLFTDMHSSSAVCTPTRYGVLTGRYAWRTTLQKGVLWGYDNNLIDSTRITVASMLKEQGYNTACIGKWHLGLGWQNGVGDKPDITKPITNGPLQNGFDYFFGITSSLDIPPYVYIENNQSTSMKIDMIAREGGKRFWRKGPIGDDFKHEEVLDVLTDKTVGYINKHAKEDDPFFIYFPLPAPHTPILPSEKFKGKSGTNEYGDFVLMVDDVVGRVTKALQENGIEENTLIVFTSDNGCSPQAKFDELAQFDHNPNYIYRGHKADIFEGGHRVPFVVKWPGNIKEGVVSANTYCLTDFLATCADLINFELPENAGEDSFTILPELLGTYNDADKRGSVVNHSINGSFAIRKDNWKLAFCPGSGGWSAPRPKLARKNELPSIQLFNLENDIGEEVNLADQFPDIVEEMTALMKEYIDNGRSTPGSVQLNDAKIELMKTL